MSKNLDFNKPLSDEERAWAEQFTHTRMQLEASDAARKGEDLAGTPDEGAEDVTPDYRSMTATKLREEINRRNKEFNLEIPTTGTKDELAARLQEDDAAASQP